MKNLKFFSLLSFAVIIFLCSCTPDQVAPELTKEGCSDEVNMTLDDFESFDLQIMEDATLKFEIIPLSDDNQAVRVFATNCEFLDNSTFGYPDALVRTDGISAAGNWADGNAVLGTTVGNGGLFEGAGNRFLGLKVQSENGTVHCGWVRLNCMQGNTRLEILDYDVCEVCE